MVSPSSNIYIYIFFFFDDDIKTEIDNYEVNFLEHYFFKMHGVFGKMVRLMIALYLFEILQNRNRFTIKW